MQPDRIHEAAPAAVFDLLNTHPDGLTAAEAEKRFGTFGSNRLRPPSALRWVRVLGRHLTNFFSLLLDVAAAVCFVAESIEPGQGMWILGWALLGVSVLNALFAFAQEMRAERAMEELQKFLPPQVRVRRDGTATELSAELLVPGDVILIGEGDRIPADARLVECEELLVNNAPLTGESRSQPMSSHAFRGELTDSPNVAFAGCSVLRGRGTAVVFATGHRTEFGKIAALSRDVHRPSSPLQRETNRMICVLTIIAVTLGVVFFAWGASTGRSLWISLVFMLGIMHACSGFSTGCQRCL
ncbi:MAG: cation-transporting P-type ATPase [Planctomycetaceae bacterium]|nr:cation-transporting P-type ATPase [Planctomycetaceae bacterium]